MIILNECNCALTPKEEELFKLKQYSPDFKTRAVANYIQKGNGSCNFMFPLIFDTKDILSIHWTLDNIKTIQQ